MAFPNALSGKYGDEKVTNTTKYHTLGTRMILPDGRVYRYMFSGAALTAGQVLMQKAGIANHDMDLVPTAAAAVGATSVSMTLGATAATANQYQDGYLYVNDGTGQGAIHRIKSHASGASSSTLTVTLEEDDDIRVALTTSDSLLGLMENPYKDVEVYDVSDIDGAPVGVCTTTVADNAYFWGQTWGPAAVLTNTGDQLPVVGRSVHAATAGADGAISGYEPLASTTGRLDTPIIGVAILIQAVSTDYQMVDLKISP